jgi:hypothetical protein
MNDLWIIENMLSTIYARWSSKKNHIQVSNYVKITFSDFSAFQNSEITIKDKYWFLLFFS